MRDVRLSLLSWVWPTTMSLRPPRRRRRPGADWVGFLGGVLLTTLAALAIVQVVSIFLAV